MTIPLSAESPRRAAARRFGLLLRKTMAARRVGSRPVAAAAHVARSAIGAWRAGDNLPTLAVALRIAESLDEPRLAAIVREARTGHCLYCARAFIHEGGRPKLYCNSSCREAAYRGSRPDQAQAARAAALDLLRGSRPDQAQAARAAALDLLRGELLRVGPVRKQSVGRALTLLTDEEERSPGLIARRRLPALQAAIEAMCGPCEPEGYCHVESCPLRGFSPLPLAIGHKDADLARRPEGAWGPSRRPARLALQREINARTWGRPGAREAQSERMRLRHAAETPEQRAAHIRALVGGQGRMRAKEGRTA